MTTVAELIEMLREFPPDMAVHVWTREEEFNDLTVSEAPSQWTGRTQDKIICRIEGA